MIDANILPWQQQQWQQLWRCYKENKLAHALLLIGVPGLGKKQFALQLAKTLLCHQVDEVGNECGQCHACHLIIAGSHPDLVLLEPLEEGRVIGVEQVRQVVQFVNETAQQGGERVIVIDPATALNNAAVNALLKTLEEPTARTLFILLSGPGLRLPATIISRCQKILFSPPPRALALTWLAKTVEIPTAVDPNLLLNLAAGGPLKAIELLTNGELAQRQAFYQGLATLSQANADPLTLAAQWQEQETLGLINLLQSWLQDLLRYKLTQTDQQIVNMDYKALFWESSQKWSMDNLLQYIDEVQQIYAKMTVLNLNRQLVLEDLFIKWTHYAVG